MNSEERLSLNMVRKFFIMNSLQLKPNKIAEFYKKNYCDNNRIFVQKFQNSTFDEFTKQKFIEDQKVIMELSGRTSRTTE